MTYKQCDPKREIALSRQGPMSNIEINTNLFPTQYMYLDVETGFLGHTIIQLAYIKCDSYNNILKTISKYIRDRNISANSYKIHSITTETLQKFGEPFEDVMTEFLCDLNDCKYVIGHNISYDIKCLLRDMFTYKITVNNEETATIFDDKIIKCTMMIGKSLRIFKTKKGMIKCPKLKELYKYYFDKEINNAHHALSDAIASMECYVEHIKRISKFHKIYYLNFMKRFLF